jgi:hypothetical protein
MIMEHQDQDDNACSSYISNENLQAISTIEVDSVSYRGLHQLQ